ncbi:hypothetical protein [Spiroplasma endosymbiont of Seladonia tumulorum]|uniref:hypothetical protein n=1 Tax=Spiroplasma endosymbiont of Seladonia tumulorum TaxID=3066321 RepID=UPI0030CE3479
MLKIRVKGLTEAITKEKLTLVLFNFLKHRGTFNIKDDKSKELLENIDANLNIIEGDSLFPCEKQLKFYEQNNYFRGQDEFYITHKDLLKEIKQILSVQIKHNLINEDFKEEYLKIFNRKREYYIGPGKGSKYGWKKRKKIFLII